MTSLERDLSNMFGANQPTAAPLSAPVAVPPMLSPPPPLGQSSGGPISLGQSGNGYTTLPPMRRPFMYADTMRPMPPAPRPAMSMPVPQAPPALPRFSYDGPMEMKRLSSNNNVPDNDYYDQDTESEPPAREAREIPKIPNKSKLLKYLGIGAVIVVAIALIVILVVKNKKKKKAAAEAAEAARLALEADTKRDPESFSLSARSSRSNDADQNFVNSLRRDAERSSYKQSAPMPTPVPASEGVRQNQLSAREQSVLRENSRDENFIPISRVQGNANSAVVNRQ